MSDTLDHAPLGHATVYPDTYSPELLFPLARDINRQSLTLPTTWYGADIWNAYEISWLDPCGKPVVALAQFVFNHDTPRLIESKSLKLYLNSLNQLQISTAEQVRQKIEADLSRTAGGSVDVQLWPIRQCPPIVCQSLDGHCIDDVDIEIKTYQPEPGLLRCATGGSPITETLVSDLLKSNCPVTGQPDWGSVQISYSGPRIEHASLLAYVISMRQHTEFHEHCVEKIFCDIWEACQPAMLSVYARYTRRGGLDINPWRSSHPTTMANIRTHRQ